MSNPFTITDTTFFVLRRQYKFPKPVDNTLILFHFDAHASSNPREKLSYIIIRYSYIIIGTK